MAADRSDNEASGRDPLEPEQLATPAEPPEPERRRSGAPEQPAGPLREPLRLRETSVRRVDHKGEAIEETGPPMPAEPAATLGDTLANERRRQGKTLADVEGATRVRGRLIDSLEHGDYDALPSPAYVKGYVQSYADFLEIPAGPLMAQLNTEMNSRAAKPDEHPYIRMPVPTEPRLRRKSSSGGKDLPGPSGRWWVWVLVLVVVVTAVIGIGRLLAASDQGVPPLPASSDKAATSTASPSGVPTSGVAATTAPGAVVATATGSAPAAGPKVPAGKFVVQVKVAAGKQSYLHVIVDGGSDFAGTASAGTKTYIGTSLITVQIGKPSVVAVTKNGQPVTVPASTGSAVTVSITK
jgi:cytoskeleton protein RodZ